MILSANTQPRLQEVHSLTLHHKVCLYSRPHGKSHLATSLADNKRKCSLGFSFPYFSLLKYLQADGGTGLWEAVSTAPMRGAPLELTGLWVALFITPTGPNLRLYYTDSILSYERYCLEIRKMPKEMMCNLKK